MYIRTDKNSMRDAFYLNYNLISFRVSSFVIVNRVPVTRIIFRVSDGKN